MKRPLGTAILFSLVFILCISFSGGFSLAVRKAYAADASLPIRVRLVRCVSADDRLSVCHSEGLCCGMADSARSDTPSLTVAHVLTVDMFTADSAPPGQNLWLRRVARRLEIPQ